MKLELWTSHPGTPTEFFRGICDNVNENITEKKLVIACDSRLSGILQDEAEDGNAAGSALLISI